jgi:hypothetical protein
MGLGQIIRERSQRYVSDAVSPYPRLGNCNRGHLYSAVLQTIECISSSPCCISDVKSSSLYDPADGFAELRFVGGLSIEETASVMGLSPATMKRERAKARAWLQRELRRDAAK